MNTLNEIVEYCLEPEVVGALLLTGEWGCGKTYLIDHLLPEKLKNEEGKSIAIVLRVSLFGMSKAEEINKAVKCLWIKAYCAEIEEKSDYTKQVKKVGKLIRKGREMVSSLEFLPDWIQGLGTTDWESFAKVKNVIGDKPVVIVFDDLERCRMDTVDVLGCINDYCENQKFHTIIVANQEKITKTNNPSNIKASINVSYLESKQKNSSKKYELDISVPNKAVPGKLSYEEIKEKIIQRTVQYIPDYESIVNTVICGMKYENQEYKEFVIENTTGMLELFAPDRVNIASQSIEGEDIFEPVSKVQNHEQPHNIRSLKCAICDFYRIYKILSENQIANLNRWLFSFSSYVIAYKAGIAKEGYYGTIFTDQIVKKLFPAYDDAYLLNSAKKWILHGIWDEDELKYEVDRLLIKQQADSPCDLVRTRRIIDLEESVADAGFPEVLHMAYSGELTLDEYVQFILNCSWMRMYNYQPSEEINWELIRRGIRKTEDELLKALPEGQILHTQLSTENRKTYSDDEWNTYLLIENFRKKDLVMFAKNRANYISLIVKDVYSAFSMCQNKRFNVFDEEMARATAESFRRCSNSDKCQFPGYFEGMWEPLISSMDFDMLNPSSGFKVLKEQLEMQKEEFEKEGNKQFALIHTDTFIKRVDALIKTTDSVEEKRKRKYEIS